MPLMSVMPTANTKHKHPARNNFRPMVHVTVVISLTPLFCKSLCTLLVGYSLLVFMFLGMLYSFRWIYGTNKNAFFKPNTNNGPCSERGTGQSLAGSTVCHPPID